MKQSVKEYIDENFDKCFRENRTDNGTLIGVPYPYVVPSTQKFNEIYYWDTYFTNVGLIRWGRAALAKNNVDNILYLVDKFGFMPNGSRTYFLYNSQPPFLSEMVKDIYEYYKDKVWLAGAYWALVKEYNFWMKNRILPNGLNAYNPEVTDEIEESYRDSFTERIGYEPSKASYEIARHALATCESGWDMNPRMGFEAYNYAPVDLNSLMYGFENNMAYFADILQNGDTKKWKHRAGARFDKMNKYMTDASGIFMDYNCADGKHSKAFSVASYYTMFCGLATKEQAKLLVDSLDRLEEKYGVVTCERDEGRTENYQWDSPNGWACLQYIMLRALENYGYREEAKRIAQKYVDTVERTFDKTQNFWEKYNVVDGSDNARDEHAGSNYKMPTMLGWSAGVYIYADEYLTQNG